MQYGFNSFESINNWNDSNAIPWLCNYKGPQLQWSWKQWMVEHSGAFGEGGGVWTTEMGRKNKSGMVLAFYESGSTNGVGM
jgi:hypothetical protein